MVNFRRRLTLGSTVAVALLATTLAGCSSSTSSDPSSAPASGSGSATDSSVSGDLTFMTWWAYANEDVVKGFAAKYPNVNVKLDFTPIDGYPTKVQTLASSGSLPDVFAAQGPYIVDLQKAGQLYDMKSALETPAYDQDGTWGSTFVPTLLAGANSSFPAEAISGGQTYGVPFNAISVASIYNKDIFDKVGITPATTFDQLLSNCTTLKAAGYIPMSLTGKVWIDWFARLAWDQTMSGQSVDSFTPQSPQYIAGFQIVEKMAKAGCWAESQISTDIAAEQALFVQEKTAQFISVPENFLASVAKDAKFTLATATLPPLDGKTPNRILGGGNANVIVINAKTKNPEAAIAFAKYLTSAELSGKLASSEYTIPAINIDMTSSNPLMKAYIDATTGGFINPGEYMPAMTAAGNTTLVTNILPELILGKITAEEAAQQTENLFVK